MQCLMKYFIPRAILARGYLGRNYLFDSAISVDAHKLSRSIFERNAMYSFFPLDVSD
jgi:hypothetical protein